MFSVMSGCSQEGSHMWPLPMMHWALLYRDPQPQPAPIPRHGTSLYRGLPPQHPLLMRSGGKDLFKHLFKLVHLRIPHPPVLTFGSYWSTYGWQAHGTHRIGILSCYICKCVVYIVQNQFIFQNQSYIPVQIDQFPFHFQCKIFMAQLVLWYQ